MKSHAFLGEKMICTFNKLVIIGVMVFGVIVTSSSFPPAWAEFTGDGHHTEHEHDDEYVRSGKNSKVEEEGLSQAHQIKLLIGVVIFLFGGNMWWTKRYVRQQEERDKVVAKEIKGINKKLDTLQGEHDMSMSLRGCAADPTELERVIKKALEPLMQWHLHQRDEDRK